MSDPLGWWKFHRSMERHAVWHLTPGQFKVWVTILSMANIKPGDWYDGRERVTIPAGSLITSQDHVAKRAKVGRIVVRRALEHLERIGSIRAKVRAKRWTLIEVVNWPGYQGGNDEASQEVSPERAQSEPSVSHNLRMGKREKKNIAGGSAPAGSDSPSKPARKKGDPDPRVRTVVAAWHDAFKAKFGSVPPVNGQHGALAKQLLAGRSEAEAVAIVREFIRETPGWHEQRGLYGLEHILKAAPEVIARRAKRAKERTAWECAQCGDVHEGFGDERQCSKGEA